MTLQTADLAATLGPVRQTYARSSDFAPVTRAYARVAQVVRETGLMRRRPWFYGTVLSVLALAFGGAITGFILFGESWFQLLIAAALGVLFTQVAFLAHEAAHQVIMPSARSNERLARGLGAIVGMSYSWWDAKHRRHHAAPNQIGKDPDIEVDTVSFLADDAAASRGIVRLITGRQGWLFFPLLTLEGVNLHFLSFKHLFSRGQVKGRWVEIALLTARFALVFAPIFLFLPLGMAFAFAGVMLATFGLYMGGSFAPNHIGMPIIAAGERVDFFTRQVRTSRNIRGGWWATWLMGGLNYQIEHHLFPTMARPHLAKAREIVRDYCQANDVPYTETSLLNAQATVIRYLNTVGLSARDPFACPLVTQYRRA
ncbi:MAG: acyl-CoA desaturase [Microbacterium sp.]